MAANAPLLSDTIDADLEEGHASTAQLGAARPGATVTAGSMSSGGTNGAAGGGGGGDLSVWRQSSHPVALVFLFLFAVAAIATYLFCGFFTDNYVLSTVIVVVLLSADFWTCRNVSGRLLVGLRYWNQVEEDGTTYWVFESRDPSQPSNALDARFFWTKIYATPVIWMLLMVVSLIKLSLNFLPIVALALVFNVSNAIGFSYADRDARKRWAQGMASGGMLGSLGSFGGLAGGLAERAVRGAIGRFTG